MKRIRGKEADRWAPAVSERSQEKEGGREVGPPRVVLFAGPVGLAGSLAIFRGCRPMKEVRNFDKNFGLKVWI
jgi:hypothetical protein